MQQEFGTLGSALVLLLISPAAAVYGLYVTVSAADQPLPLLPPDVAICSFTHLMHCYPTAVL